MLEIDGRTVEMASPNVALGCGLLVPKKRFMFALEYEDTKKSKAFKSK
jgi:hypothetical protein